MMKASGTPVAQLRKTILRSVSRSFYLSIRLLPKKLRDPIALAYLLARATDTIADTVGISASVRAEQLSKLAALIQGNAAPEAAAAFSSFTALQKNAAERALLDALPDCLAWLHALSVADRDDIRAVLAKINEGQALDVQRFADPTRVTALPTAADLQRYTYLVAGCVGEFWTRVCARHLTNFSSRPSDEMLSLGRNFGQGLQLVNILRDAGSDLRAGRCYLPANELQSLGLTPEGLLAQPERAAPIITAWRERAEEGMAAGLEYACAIRSWRVRLATALPALIGARTLALLRAAGPRIFTERVKVGRPEVRQIVFGAIPTLASAQSLRSAFGRLSSD